MAVSVESLNFPKIEVVKPIENEDYSRTMDLTGKFMLNVGKWLVLSEVILGLNRDLPDNPFNIVPLAVVAVGAALRIASRLPESEAGEDTVSQMDW